MNWLCLYPIVPEPFQVMLSRNGKKGHATKDGHFRSPYLKTMTEQEKKEVQSIIDKGLDQEAPSFELEELRHTLLNTCVNQWAKLSTSAQLAGVDPEIAWESYKDMLKRAFVIGLPKE